MKELTEIKNSETNKEIPRCGLCGKTTNLTKTECCNQWICNDEANYKLFSFERNSCYRNHRRYTLCGYHYANGHDGNWKDCEECKKAYDIDLYVYFGTNEYNFEKLENPPKFEYKKCSKCGKTIKRGEEGYSVLGDTLLCERCSAEDLAKLMSENSL